MNTTNYKPAIALFGFNRPDCTRQVFEEIRRYRPEKLFLIADGPRPSVPADAEKCKAVRDLMTAVDWPCEVITDFSATNLGCKTRMASGIERVFSQVEEAVILEDDCLPHADFFRYCAEMLARYRNDARIMHISGTNLQRGQIRGEGSYYFSRCIQGWGWASWRRAWKRFDFKMLSWPEARRQKWLSHTGISRLEQEYWDEIFENTYQGKFNSWDYQWLYVCWREGMGITPNVNLITNIGNGPDATHTAGIESVPTKPLGEIKHPKTISIDKAADQFIFEDHYGGSRLRAEKSWYRLIRDKLSRLKHRLWAEEVHG